MNIILNNESDEVHEGITIKEFLDDKKINTKYIAIEINKEIIPKSSYINHELKEGDKIEIVGIKDTIETTATGIEMFRKLLDYAEAGDNVGVLLRGIEKDQVERGLVLCAPGSIKPHQKFEAEVYVLKKEEGGRHTPFFKGYRPQFYFRTTDVTGSIELGENVEMVMPGDNTKMNVDLICPVAMADGLKFSIREGGRTVGAGVISKITEK